MAGIPVAVWLHTMSWLGSSDISHVRAVQKKWRHVHEPLLWTRALSKRQDDNFASYRWLEDPTTPAGFCALFLKNSLDSIERESALKDAGTSPACGHASCVKKHEKKANDAKSSARRTSMTCHFLEIAAHKGRADVLEHIWVHERQLVPDTSRLRHVLDNACLGGHLDTVVLLHQVWGVALTINCWMAAEYAKWPVIHYLHKHKCPWDANSLAQAACYGHTAVVRWLINNGYVRSDHDCKNALDRTEHPAVIALLLAQRTRLALFGVVSF